MRRRGLLGLLLAPLALRGMGGTPGEPSGYVPPSLPGVAAGSASQIIRARQVIVSGPGGGVYVYQAGTVPALGNPPIFWAGSSPDPFGNVLPATAGVAGTGTFAAGNTLITPAGIFTYSGTPAAANLSESQAPAGGTDAFGNNYLAGVVSYIPTSIFGALASQLLNGGILFYTAATEAGPWTQQANIGTDGSGQLVFTTGGGLTGGSIPQSSSGITTVSQVVTALVQAGVLH